MIGTTFVFAPKILHNTDINNGNPNPIIYINNDAVGINSWKKFESLFPCIVLVKLPQPDTNTINNV